MLTFFYWSSSCIILGSRLLSPLQSRSQGFTAVFFSATNLSQVWIKLWSVLCPPEVLTQGTSAETVVCPRLRFGLVTIEDLLHELFHREPRTAVAVAAGPLNAMNCKENSKSSHQNLQNHTRSHQKSPQRNSRNPFLLLFVRTEGALQKAAGVVIALMSSAPWHRQASKCSSWTRCVQQKKKLRRVSFPVSVCC